MIRKLLNFFFPARTRAQRLADAEVTWMAARAAYAAARDRNDTRAKHETGRAVRDARHALLRLELGR